MIEMRIGKLHLHTHNGLLTNYAGADGMKTGSSATAAST